MTDTFQSVKQLVSELIAYKQANPEKKIAFVFQGGGARAAWYGGMLEAIENEVRRQQPAVAPELRFAPDILVGNSGGALAAVAYFCDLLNSGTYGRYANRQSWMWRELSRDNEGAFKLLDNPGVLELISGSKSGGTASILPSLSNPQAIYNLIPKVGPIANMAEKLSPHYNFQALFKSRAELWAAWNNLKTRFDDFRTAMDNLTLPNLIAGINTQQVSSVWNDGINLIRDRVDAVKNDVEAIKNHLSHTNKLGLPDQVPDAFNVPLLRDAAWVAVEIGSAIDNLKRELDNLAITAANGLLTNLKTAFEAIQNLHVAVTQEVAALTNHLLEIVTHLDDFISLVTATALMAKNHASVMNTSGLERVLHEALRQATPAKTAPSAKASEMDTAIFTHWKARREAKALDPQVRAPELILTASNISAARPTLLCMCDPTTKLSLANSHTWIVELDQGNVSFGSAKEAAKTTPPPSDPTRWIFGSWPTDYMEQFIADDIPLGTFTAEAVDDPPADAGEQTPVRTFTPVEMTMQGSSVADIIAGMAAPTAPVQPAEVTVARRMAAPLAAAELRSRPLPQFAQEIIVGPESAPSDPAQPPTQLGFSVGAAAISGGTINTNLGASTSLKDLLGSPFSEPEPWKSEIKGTSLIAAAALTTSAIPLVFPPKYWRFNNAYGETYHHWMVDGGLCDNRPIQQATNAGAECIVSFELTPLSAAIQDIPLDDDRPDIGEVAVDSLLKTPMASAFYRFLETYVGDQSAANPATSVRMWRIAPAQTEVNAKSVGPLDFNGYWEGGQLRMGLFDWFMRGYLDAHAGELPTDVWNDPNDNACAAYKAVAVGIYGQVGNANQKEASPGFFVVDFQNNHPHPGYK